MQLSTRYLARRVLVASLLVAAVLTLAVWLTQILMFAQVVINRAIPFTDSATFLLLLLPGLLAIVLPGALLVAICFVYHRLLNDSELVILRAAGASNLSIAWPALLVGIVVTAFAYWLSLSGVPASLRAFRSLQHEIGTTHRQAMLEAGVFTEVTPGVTIFARERDPEGRLLGVLVNDVREPRKAVTYIAARGILSSGEEMVGIALEDGTAQQTNRAIPETRVTYFDRMTVALQDEPETADERNIVPQERPLGELLDPAPGTSNTQRNAFRAEANQRLVAPLYCLAFSALSLALLLCGTFQRRSHWMRIGMATAAGVGLQLCATGLQNLAVRVPGLVPLMYALPLLVLAVALGALLRQQLRGARPRLPTVHGLLPRSFAPTARGRA